ncbi:hypothetical protein LTR06_003406 [Exophiala xenobiotica]|nr:hypothetical protein LTR06_003406 [Exophiala xenobiotica]
MASAAAPFTFVHETSHCVVDGITKKTASTPRRYICDTAKKNHLIADIARKDLPESPRDLLSRHEKTLHSLEYEEPVHNSHRGLRRDTRRHNSLGSTVLSKTPRKEREDRPTNLANNDTIVIPADTDLFKENRPTNDDAALVEAPLDLLDAQMDILPSTSRLNTDYLSMEQTNLSGGSGPFPPFAGSIFSSNGNAAEAGQGLQDLQQGNASGQNTMMPYTVPKDQPEPVPSFAMPLELATPDFFALIDDSLFTQMSFPGEMIDFEFSPEALGASRTLNSSRNRVLGSADNVQQTSPNSDVVSSGSKVSNDGSILNPQSPKHRSSKSERPTIDNLVKTILLDDLRGNYQIDEQQLTQLPSPRMLDNFLCKFFQCFQRHLPIFHVPTFDPATTPAPLNSATFDVPPGFSGFRDLDFEIPVEEALWDAPTREEWQQLIDTRVDENPVTLSAVLSQLVLGDETTSSNRIYSRLGRFATTVIMHGVNVHMYYLAQSRSSLMMNNVDANIGYTVRLSHHTQTERALTRCQEFLKTWQLAHDDSQHSRQEDSLIFNCQALLRLSYVRVFSGMRYFNRTTLLYEDPDLIASAVGAYLSESRERTAFLTKAAEQVMFCFTTPIRAGHMLTRKTAAFTWSIEHAVACWDCNLFLGKWIHNVEIQEADTALNQEEIAIFDSLKEALQDAENPYDPQMSLAAQVTRTWADFMDDVWVWQITLRMGSVLRQLAKVYESSWQERRALTYGLQSAPELELR